MRQIGTFEQPFSFEVKIRGMMDARMAVPTYADLLTFVETNYLFNGFIVAVYDPDPDLRGIWQLIDYTDLSNPDSWVQIAGRGDIWFREGSLVGTGTFDDPYAPNGTNGLTVTDDPIFQGIQWGGDLLQDTAINMGGFGVGFNGGTVGFELSPQVPDGVNPNDAVAFEQLTGLLPDKILSGLGLTISFDNLSVYVAPGTWRIGGVIYTSGSTITLPIPPQDSIYSALNLVYAYPTNDSINNITGVFSLTPATPDTPAGTLDIGTVLIPSATPSDRYKGSWFSDTNISTAFSAHDLVSLGSLFGFATANSAIPTGTNTIDPTSGVSVQFNSSYSDATNQSAWTAWNDAATLWAAQGVPMLIVQVGVTNPTAGMAFPAFSIVPGNVVDNWIEFNIGGDNNITSGSGLGLLTKYRFSQSMLPHDGAWHELLPFWKDSNTVTNGISSAVMKLHIDVRYNPAQTNAYTEEFRIRTEYVSGSTSSSFTFIIEFPRSTQRLFYASSTSIGGGMPIIPSNFWQIQIQGTDPNTVLSNWSGAVGGVGSALSGVTMFGDNLIDSTGATFLKSSTSGVGTVTNFIFTDSGGFTGTVGTSTTTPTLSLVLQNATTSQSGQLISTDWNIFNNKQDALSGTGFVKSTAGTISYDTSTYLTTSSATATYLPLAGGTMTGFLTLSADPTNALHAATKSYIDNLITGITWKQEVRAATTANITLSGTQTVDGIALVANDRVLVRSQTSQIDNGIYLVSAGAWTRTTDADTGAEIGSATVLVRNGTVYKDTQWTCTNSTDPTIGVDNITFGQIAGAGIYTNGPTLSLSGNVFSLNLSNANIWAALQTFGTNISIGGVTASGATGTGNIVFATSPTLTTPTLGVASATSINKVAITAPATSATLTIADGKTLTMSNTLTFTGTDSSTLNIGTGGTLGTNAYTSTAYVPTSTTVNGKALSANITLGLASADFVNQGTTTTILHGNAAGNPSFGSIVNADIAAATIDLTAKVTGLLPDGNISSAANWNTAYNNRIQSFATTGSSGAATWNSGTGALVIPNYTLSGLGGVPTTTTVAGFALSGNITLAALSQGTGITAFSYTGAATQTVAIDQTFAPTWTGVHTFNKTVNATPADELTLSNTTAAALGAQQYSPGLNFAGFGWGTTAGTSQAIAFRTYVLPLQGTTASGSYVIDASVNGAAYVNKFGLSTSGTLTITGAFVGGNLTANVSSIAAGSSDGLLTANNTAALVGAQVQNTPRLRFHGTVWNTTAVAATNNYDWGIEARPTAGTTPVSTMYWMKSLVASGVPSFSDVMNLTDAGKLTTASLNLTGLTASKLVFTDSSKNLTSTGIGTSSQFIAGDGSLVTIGARPHTIFTPTTGGTVSLTTNQYNIINPAGALLALTVNLPSSPSNNDCVFIKFTQNVTTVTYANGTVADGITAPTAGGLVVLVYDSGATTWY